MSAASTIRSRLLRAATGRSTPCALRLAPGQTTALLLAQPQVLRIDGGCAWVTLSQGARDDGRTRAGDVFVAAGETLSLPAGSRVVVEAVCGMALQGGWQRCAAPAPQARLPQGRVAAC